ncbi:hypothetical protein PISL3812_07395 [Talaromyces islandicus]|uniref:AB hydrolase-1 domain-containing protein n=1 Tax=Talaromyces islandicus TaxID=28573 RepID=A0A0U1M4P0_TALIS|nr:hypothetical protein PISL3812_07395 [Talaromyces islandicus]
MVQPHTSTRDIIVHPSQNPSSPYHIFFLPGNPGLVEYYAGFLDSLHQSLNSASSSSPGFHVAGCSFAGFETSSPSSTSSATRGKEQLYSITEQTDFALEKLRQCITITGSDKKEANQKKVVIIGHSFGTFVATEMMKRIHTEQLREAFEVVGAVLLFPPIPDLEMSPRGSKLAALLRWKYLPGICSSLAGLVHILPVSWSNAIIRHVTAFPADALETTRAFFGSRTGVAQALYLGRLEIDDIKPSRWESAFQAISKLNSPQSRPPLIRIFFGKDDHWVLNELRDAFMYQYCDAAGPKKFGNDLNIEARIDPSQDGDETSVVIPHDFSIRHSEHVVPYVVEYINEIVHASAQ